MRNAETLRDEFIRAEALKMLTTLNIPSNYDTGIGDRIALVSGRQKQRITIARAFLRDPYVFMLDEATIFLNNKNES